MTPLASAIVATILSLIGHQTMVSPGMVIIVKAVGGRQQLLTLCGGTSKWYKAPLDGMMLPCLPHCRCPIPQLVGISGLPLDHLCVLYICMTSMFKTNPSEVIGMDKSPHRSF